MSLYYDGDNIYLFVNEKEIFRFKADNKSVNFPTQFCLGIYLMEFCATDSREVSLKANVCKILVDYNAIDKPGILNFYKYLKSDSQPPKKCLICFNESLSKMMENLFYFVLKALFVLKIFNFLSWIFGHLEKTAWLERQG